MTAETKKRPGVCDILILAVTAAMMIGARTWFAPCDHLTESGGYMACHWAGEALKAASPEEITQVPGVPKNVAEAVYRFLCDSQAPEEPPREPD